MWFIVFILLLGLIVFGFVVWGLLAGLLFGGRDPYEDYAVMYDCADRIAESKSKGDTLIDARSLHVYKEKLWSRRK